MEFEPIRTIYYKLGTYLEKAWLTIFALGIRGEVPEVMKRKELEGLIQEGEGSRIEFKQQLNVQNEGAKEEFIKDIIAMANTSPGDGYILYGVSDTGKIIGLSKHKGLDETLMQIIASRCYPPPKCYTEWLEIDDKNVLTLHILESQLRPHFTFKKDVYVRRGKIIDKAHPAEIYQMMSHGIPKNTEDTEKSLDMKEQLKNEYIGGYAEYDPHFFPLSGSPQTYRICRKSKPFDDPAICPIFMPHYGIFVPEPEFGYTKSVICFDLEGRENLERELFYSFLKLMENRIDSISNEAGIWRRFPLSWSVSTANKMMYGLGAENAKLALNASSERSLFGGIIQFERVSVYKPTNFLVFAADLYPNEEPIYIRHFALKIMLSTLPLSNNWVNSLLDIAEILGYKQASRKVGDDATSEPLYTLDWKREENNHASKVSAIKPKVLGLMGRDYPMDSLEVAMGLGVVIDTKSLRGTKLEIDKDGSSNWDSYYNVLNLPPCLGFSELPIQITNPIPTFGDINKRDFAISVPSMRQAIIGLGGYVVLAINAHAFPRHER